MFRLRILGLFGVLSWAGVEMPSEARSKQKQRRGRLGLQRGGGYGSGVVGSWRYRA